jgi:hypothetical protein
LEPAGEVVPQGDLSGQETKVERVNLPVVEVEEDEVVEICVDVVVVVEEVLEVDDVADDVAVVDVDVDELDVDVVVEDDPEVERMKFGW